MEFDSEGVRLHYELHGPDSGPPVIVVHGFASDYQLNWVGTRWEEALVVANYRVIGLDCRGHGRSDKPHGAAPYAIDIMAADVRRLLDELGIGTCHYIGYSMGGRIGLQCVLDFPERLREPSAAGTPRARRHSRFSDSRRRDRSTTWRRLRPAWRAWVGRRGSTVSGWQPSGRRYCLWPGIGTRSPTMRRSWRTGSQGHGWSSSPAATTWGRSPRASSRRRRCSSSPK